MVSLDQHCTDFSAKIRVNPTRNSKNDVVWSHSRDEAGDKLEAEEEQRKTPPELMPRHGCAWARLGSTVVVMQSMLVDGVFEGSDKTEDWPAHRPDPDHEDGASPRSCEGQARGG